MVKRKLSVHLPNCRGWPWVAPDVRSTHTGLAAARRPMHAAWRCRKKKYASTVNTHIDRVALQIIYWHDWRIGAVGLERSTQRLLVAINKVVAQSKRVSHMGRKNGPTWFASVVEFAIPEFREFAKEIYVIEEKGVNFVVSSVWHYQSTCCLTKGRWEGIRSKFKNVHNTKHFGQYATFMASGRKDKHHNSLDSCSLWPSPSDTPLLSLGNLRRHMSDTFGKTFQGTGQWLG